VRSSRSSAATSRETSLATLDLAGTLGERVRSGRRAERFRATPDLPNIIRMP
jgi:hypothetical protein